jgi:hypothetical protein
MFPGFGCHRIKSLPARDETAEPIGDAQKQRRLIGSVAQFGWQRHAEKVNAVADGRNTAGSTCAPSKRMCLPWLLKL